LTVPPDGDGPAVTFAGVLKVAVEADALPAPVVGQ
jgi:hypothetical protein